MPILDNFTDHDLFGPLPHWVSERIGQLGNEEVEDMAVRFPDVQSLEELFGE